MCVVFVPGFTQSAASWQTLVECLRELPWSMAPIDVPDGLDFAATAAAIGELGGRGVYAGYSMGGRLCLQLALDRPELVERLVLVSGSPGIADLDARATRRDADELLARDIERDGVDAFLERWLAQPLFATLTPETAGMEQRRRANSVERLTHQLRALGQGSQPSNWDRLDQLQMPSLMIAGALDAKYADIAQRMAIASPSAAVEVITGSGHACHLEQPERVAHAMASWSA